MAQVAETPSRKVFLREATGLVREVGFLDTAFDNRNLVFMTGCPGRNF